MGSNVPALLCVKFWRQSLKWAQFRAKTWDWSSSKYPRNSLLLSGASNYGRSAFTSRKRGPCTHMHSHTCALTCTRMRCTHACAHAYRHVHAHTCALTHTPATPNFLFPNWPVQDRPPSHCPSWPEAQQPSLHWGPGRVRRGLPDPGAHHSLQRWGGPLPFHQRAPPVQHLLHREVPLKYRDFADFIFLLNAWNTMDLVKKWMYAYISQNLYNPFTLLGRNFSREKIPLISFPLCKTVIPFLCPRFTFFPHLHKAVPGFLKW